MNLSGFTVGWKSASESQQILPLFQVWRSEIRDLSGAQLTGAATFLIPKVWGTQCQWSHEHPGSRTVPCTLTPRKHQCSSRMPAPRSDWSIFLGLVALRHETQAEISEGGERPESNGEILEDCWTKKVFLKTYRSSFPSSSYLLSSFFISGYNFHLQVLFPDPRDLTARRPLPADNSLLPNPNLAPFLPSLLPVR